MKIRDLLTKNNCVNQYMDISKIVENSLSGILLLTDQRSFQTLEIENFHKRKRLNTTYFNLVKMSYDFVERKMSLKKKVYSPPYYTRGMKGFVLNDSFVHLLPLRFHNLVKNVMAENKVKICLIKDLLLTLPFDYIRLL